MSLSDQDWLVLLEAARRLGSDAGANAASWWEQDAIGGRSRTTDDDVRAALVKFEESDPAIMDTLPWLDLSGQWADGETAEDVVRLVVDDVSEDELTLEPEEEFELVEAFRDAYDAAVSDECERMLRARLAD